MTAYGNWTTIEHYKANSYGTAHTFSFAATPADGELIVIFASTHNQGADYKPVAEAGFTEAFASAGTYRWITCYYRVASAEDNSYTVSTTLDQNINIFAYRISGQINTTSPIAQTPTPVHAASGSSSISISTAAATTSGNLLLAYFHSHGTGSEVAKSWNAGWTVEGTFGISDVDEKASAGQSADGTTQTATVTLSSGTNDRMSIGMIELAEQVSDTTPDQFTFTDVTDAARSTLTTSAAITITGINAAASISISGGGNPQYEINNSGTWTSASGTVNNNDTVKVRLTSSSLNSTTTSATLNVGGVTDAFDVTTVAAALRTDTLYRPNSTSTVTDATNVTVRIWNATSISGAPNSVLANQSVTSGVLESTVTGANAGDAVSYQLRWTVGGETRFLEAVNQTIVDAS